ncbi:MAG TPA: glutaminyl-peptide cyclotransferase [Bacteroidales bacterium]|nr:glutaminyl-peptide cyclotransferase [Bacteroidales bacterium]
MHYKFIITAVISAFFAIQSCSNDKSGNGQSTEHTKPVPEQPAVRLKIGSPVSNQVIKPGKTFAFNMNITGKATIDSVQVFLGPDKLAVLQQDMSADLKIENVNPASTFVRARAFLEGGKSVSASVPVKVVSDIVPAKYSYRVINEYPHDTKAYTQGLEYVNGYLYEGTGNYGESSLRKEDLETGEILKFRNLPSNIFGEGITYLNGKIYQITYKSQVGFVYNAENFEIIKKIYYQNKEGWGLCNNGKNILMSDGTNIIYYMDTTYFSVEKKIQVFDNEGEVDLLNELELINGKLYANRYTTNEIVIIDPDTGKVLGKIDMSGILKPEDRHPGIDYFNGIAYDKKNNRIFVTGKYWPKIYQVTFLEVR